MVNERRLWTPPYVLLCLTLFASCVHQGMLEPVLPLYVADASGSVVLAGFALAAFSVASFGLRPLVGFAVDRLTPQLVLLAGTALLMVCGATLLIPVLALLFVANALRGLGWAGMNTGCYALLFHVSPPTRRGEASVYYTVAGNVSGVFAPALGLWLVAGTTGFAGAFVAAAGAALLAHVGARFLAPMAAQRQPARHDRPATTFGVASFIDRGVLPVTLLMVCFMVANASNAFIPLYARTLGIENVGLYYVVGSTTGVIARLFFGRYSDRTSRELWIGLGFLLGVAGLVTIRSTSGLDQLVLGGVIYALGMAAASPMLLALAIDLGNPARPGAAMATFSAAFQIGPAIGAPAAGWLIESFGYDTMYAVAIGVATVGFFLTLIRRQRGDRWQRPRTERHEYLTSREIEERAP